MSLFKICLLSTLLFCPFSGAMSVDSKNLRFNWAANDGSFFYSCSHTLQNAEMNDWVVNCGARQFNVHFFLREFSREKAPQKTFEVLYFITGSSNSSQGVWIDIEKESQLQGLSFHQSVDNDSSDLVLYYKSTKK
ncbi:MAG: hypothetical protein RJB66_1573 [Pseudomonadota bacterium]|jgi:hypothetical protein